jgi:hypothetical protein
MSPQKQPALKFHDLCELIPPLEGEDYQRLEADVRENGQRVKIPLYKGKALDGRARARACLALGIEPQVQEVDVQGCPAAYVLSLNLQRRHLSSQQRAAIGVRFAPLIAGEAAARKRKGRSPDGAGGGRGRRKNLPQNLGGGNGAAGGPDRHAGEADQQVARLVGSNRTYVAAARAIGEKDPELLGRVAKGELTLEQAKKQALGAAAKGPPRSAGGGGELKDVTFALNSVASLLARNLGAIKEALPGLAAREKAALADKLSPMREQIQETLALLGAGGAGGRAPATRGRGEEE